MNPVHELRENHFRRLHPAKITKPRSCRLHSFSFPFAFKPMTCSEFVSRRLDAAELSSTSPECEFRLRELESQRQKLIPIVKTNL
jgi:hypothetical protein